MAAVLRDLAGGAGADELITNLLRSVVAAAVGPVGFWPDARALERSALAPIIAWLEEGGAPIHGQGAAIARDAGPAREYVRNAIVVTGLRAGGGGAAT